MLSKGGTKAKIEKIISRFNTIKNTVYNLTKVSKQINYIQNLS